MNESISPLTAATHPDPYPYYRQLLARQAPFFDAQSKLWVVANAEHVSAVLAHPQARVRPVAAPVPEPIVGSAAGDVFGSLVRMNDGERQQRLKRVVGAALATLQPTLIEARTEHWSRKLLRECHVTSSAHGIRDYCYRLPVYVVADLLGVPEARLAAAASWIADFVRCIAPGGTPEQIVHAKQAAVAFQGLMRELLSHAPERTPGLLHQLRDHARQEHGVSEAEVVANAIGFLSQTYEATAGLLGNTVLALAAHPELRDELASSRELTRAAVAEVSRFDPSIQNTRRFFAGAAEIAGQQLAEGDTVLVLLAAANRDPELNPDPDQFLVERSARRSLTFGTGKHECPGATIAQSVAAGSLAVQLVSSPKLGRLVRPNRYRPSANARVPELELEIGPENSEGKEAQR